MSTIETQNFKDLTTGKSVDAAYITDGVAKAHGFFDGTGTPAFYDSFNFSSITDNGTGNYTLNLTSSMANSNYTAHATSTVSVSSAPDQTRAVLKAAGSFRYIHADDEPASSADVSENNAAIWGDLA